MKINEWVRAARLHKGWTQEQLGNELDVTKGNVSGWENGRHEPGYGQLLTIEAVTGYRLTKDTHPSGGLDDPPDFDRPQFSRAGEPAAPYSAQRHAPTMQPILAWEHADDLPPGEYVMIPRLDVHLSAGPGKDQVEIEFVEKQPQAFRADWIRSEHLKPAKLACLNASGTSMEPTIWDGDSLVVDTSQCEVVDGKVYALWYEGGERVKRLYRLPGGGLRIKSDNPEFQPIELTVDHVGHVRIIGRVVHRSGKGGL